MLKKAITGAGAVLMAPPAFAQAYSPGDGPGNVIDLPLAEATNGAAGIGASAYGLVQQGSSAYAYASRPRHVHRRHVHRYYAR